MTEQTATRCILHGRACDGDVNAAHIMQPANQPRRSTMTTEQPPAENNPTTALQRRILDLFEEYERETAAARAAAHATADVIPLADRLAEAGRIRAEWKATEPKLPHLITEAAADGMKPAEISRHLGISHASGYVARILRQPR